MNRVKKIVFVLSLFLTAGIAYAIFALKNIPEIFDWNLEEDEHENY